MGHPAVRHWRSYAAMRLSSCPSTLVQLCFTLPCNTRAAMFRPALPRWCSYAAMRLSSFPSTLVQLSSPSTSVQLCITPHCHTVRHEL
eukprot:1162100-Pelagomonas_calceolata.AAC.3